MNFIYVTKVSFELYVLKFHTVFLSIIIVLEATQDHSLKRRVVDSAMGSFVCPMVIAFMDVFCVDQWITRLPKA